jgi:carboxyl-terminal processing protease
MNNKKIQVWLPLLFSLTMVVGLYLGYKMRDNMPGKSFFYREQRRPIQEIIDLIENKYVDDVRAAAITDTAIQALLNRLDPHSVYIPAENLDNVNEDIAGRFYGIGVEFNIFDDTVNVVNVLPDGPGFKAGVQIGDKFLKVGDSTITGKKMSFDDVRKFLRGDKGSTVMVALLRSKEIKTVAITRGTIPLTSIDASYMIDNVTGYIRLNKFSQQTYREFMETLMALKDKGMAKLVLDLRGNGGGVLDEAAEIADEFLAGDKLITYTEGKHVPKKEYRCKRTGQFETQPLVLLADEGTASASEILIGALQDWDRATVIGRRSFGKGLVQEQFELSDNSALRLTIARYYTPLGRSIQRPYNSGGKNAYYEEINKRFNNGQTQYADSVKNDSTKIFTTKSGKKVFGGGGITPDYFVAIDTGGYSITTAKLYARNTTSTFAYQYYLRNTAALKNYKTAGDFVKTFTLTESDWKDFTATATKDSVALDKISAREKAEISNRVTALIARQVWRSSGMFEAINKNDATIKKALEILNK